MKDDIRKQVFEAGQSDTLADDLLCENALAYIESNIPRKLTKEETNELIQEYIKGFISGF